MACKGKWCSAASGAEQVAQCCKWCSGTSGAVLCVTAVGDSSRNQSRDSREQQLQHSDNQHSVRHPGVDQPPDSLPRLLHRYCIDHCIDHCIDYCSSVCVTTWVYWFTLPDRQGSIHDQTVAYMSIYKIVAYQHRQNAR